MLSNTHELFLVRPTWTDSNTLAIGALVFLLLSLLWQDWRSPIPFGALIGLIAGSLLGMGLGIANSASQYQLIQGTKELVAVGTVIGFFLGLMFKLLFGPKQSEVEQTQPERNQPPTS